MARPTRHEVAATARVSLASASRVLSGGSASTRMIRRVRVAVRQVSYLPDATARALGTGADMAVTGVDDTEFAAADNPTLTSVSLFAGRRGALAADVLLSRFDERHRDARLVEVSPDLVICPSTTPPLVGTRY